MGGDGSGANREAERLRKINEIFELVSSSRMPMKKKFVIGQHMYRYGTSRRTALEYVNVLLDAEKIEEVEGKLQIK